MAKRGNNEGSIFKRKDGRWAASVTMPDGARRSFYGKTRQDAAQKLLKAQRAIADGLPLAGERLTIGQFLETWLQDSVGRKVRPHTLRSYRQVVRLHLVPTVGQVRLARLTPAHVEKMMNEGLAGGQSPRSVAYHRAVLRNALNVAMRHGLVVRNVASLAEPPHIPEREFHALTTTTAKALLDAVKGDRLEALFTVALACGLRQSEALGLRWSDVDLDEATLDVLRTLQRIDRAYRFLEPKTTHSRRTIALPSPVVASLREHRGRQIEERLRTGAAWQGEQWEGLVFADEVGSPLSGFHVTRRFRALLKMAGLPPMRYHDLRHGSATLMAAQGVPARVAMEMLGHAQISTTMNIYTHIAPELQREAAERMGTTLWGRA